MGEMRMVPISDFYSKIHEQGLEPTEVLTITGRLWKHDSGFYISIPTDHDEFPQLLLDRLLRHLEKLNNLPSLPN